MPKFIHYSWDEISGQTTVYPRDGDDAGEWYFVRHHNEGILAPILEFRSDHNHLALSIFLPEPETLGQVKLLQTLAEKELVKTAMKIAGE